MNAVPLPAVPEVFGVRLPPASECLSSVDFDLVPNKPPPGVKQFDEEIEEIEESESESEEEIDEDIEMGQAPGTQGHTGTPSTMASQEPVREEAPFPISAIATPSDIDMISTPAQGARMETEEASDGADDDEEGLFAGGDDDEEESDAMEEVSTALVENTNGVKRKLVEEDDYD